MDTQNPLVSVVLCVYNGEKYLREQLDSIVHQTYPRIEIIALNDVSIDRSGEILEEYAQSFPIKIFTNEDNLGYIKNFEKGISLAEGDLIALADQDDIWDNKKIQLLVNQISGSNLIYANSEMVDSFGVSLNTSMMGIRNFVKGEEYKKLLLDNCVSGHNILFKKELKTKILPFHPDFHYDWWIALVAISTGKIDYSGESLVKYRQHRENITDALKSKKDLKKTIGRSQRKNMRHYQLLDRLEYFASNPAIRKEQKEFTEELIRCYALKRKRFFVVALFSMLYKNRKELFFISKKSPLKILFHIFRESFGI